MMQVGKARLVYNWLALSQCRTTALSLSSPCLSPPLPTHTWAECLLTWSHSYAALCFLHPSFLVLHVFPSHSTKRRKGPDSFFFPSFKHLNPASSPQTLIYLMTKSCQFYILHTSQICLPPCHSHCSCYSLGSDLIFHRTIKS